MDIYADISTGSPSYNEIFYTVLERDTFLFSHSTNIPLTKYTIDEVSPDNEELCRALLDYNRFKNRKDANGDDRLKIFASLPAGWTQVYPDFPDGSILAEKDNWQEEDNGF
ncbi:MAG: hypothetical protein KAS32_30570 [Candidatus Peribacteraceae bacterium]|nr:hypothetical protein [Candidatus Peribacteraceae bacterium]